MNNKIKMDWTVNLSPINGLPMLDSPAGADVNAFFKPRPDYDIKLAALQAKVAQNHAAYIKSLIDSTSLASEEKINKLVSLIKDKYSNFFEPKENIDTSEVENEIGEMVNHLIESFNTPPSTKAANLADYDQQYKVIERPFVAEHLHSNELFAYWRVAGNNPVALRGIKNIPDKFPLEDEQYQKVMGDDDHLAQALSENRVYMLDYHYLNDAVAEDGYLKNENAGSSNQVIGYSYAAMALFAVSKKNQKLTPVAIQCGQDPDDNNPMFLALDESDDNHWGWERAKYIIQAADESEHQLSTHLGLTHLLCEVFALATVRNFSSTHPLYRLLISHFEGTNRINHNATVALLGEQQFVDKLFAAPLGKLAQTVIDVRLNYNFYDHFLPTDLKLRGVDDTNALPDYPYRDDGLLIWEAIKEWVTNYINHTYTTSAQLANDKELTNWMDDIVENGKIKGFKKVKTKAELIDILTMIIFTSSAQHAAVNFTQPPWMMYAPATCGTMRYSKPTSVIGSTKEHWLDTLPGLPRALDKIDIYTLLGELHNGYLGEYVDWHGVAIFNATKDREIYKYLGAFRTKLQSISNIIEKRNGSRPFPYTYLIPKNIPASINI